MKYYDADNKVVVSFREELADNIKILEELFTDCDDIVKKQFEFPWIGRKISAYMIYVDGLTDNTMVQEHVIEPLVHETNGSVLNAVPNSSLIRLDLPNPVCPKKQMLYVFISFILQH